MAFFAVALAAGKAPATDFNWDRGGASALWATPDNWNPAGIPDFQDNIILTGASLPGLQTIDLAGTRSINLISANGVNGT
jgi:hypothetical protein